MNHGKPKRSRAWKCLAVAEASNREVISTGRRSGNRRPWRMSPFHQFESHRCRQHSNNKGKRSFHCQILKKSTMKKRVNKIKKRTPTHRSVDRLNRSTGWEAAIKWRLKATSSFSVQKRLRIQIDRDCGPRSIDHQGQARRLSRGNPEITSTGLPRQPEWLARLQWSSFRAGGIFCPIPQNERDAVFKKTSNCEK